MFAVYYIELFANGLECIFSSCYSTNNVATILFDHCRIQLVKIKILCLCFALSQQLCALPCSVQNDAERTRSSGRPTFASATSCSPPPFSSPTSEPSRFHSSMRKYNRKHHRSPGGMASFNNY